MQQQELSSEDEEDALFVSEREEKEKMRQKQKREMREWGREEPTEGKKERTWVQEKGKVRKRQNGKEPGVPVLSSVAKSSVSAVFMPLLMSSGGKGEQLLVESSEDEDELLLEARLFSHELRF
jgi:hypothetical protein